MVECQKAAVKFLKAIHAVTGMAFDAMVVQAEISQTAPTAEVKVEAKLEKSAATASELTPESAFASTFEGADHVQA